MSIADELEKLANLRDNGALTEDEFQIQKAKILGKKDYRIKEKVVDQKKEAQSIFSNGLFINIIKLVAFGYGCWILFGKSEPVVIQPNISVVSATTKTEDILEQYYLGKKNVSFSITLDNTPYYTVQIANGNMKVIGGTTVMYQGNISKFKFFDENCIGTQSSVIYYYICFALNPTNKTGQSGNGETYFKVNKGDLFYQEIRFPNSETFPTSTFYGKVQQN